MIKTDEVLLKSGNTWLHFSKPHKVITTSRVLDVCNAMNDVEALVNQNNWHAAGFVSYEAAPAFDKAFQTLDSGDFPLLWFGLYSQPQEVKSLPPSTQTFETHNWQPTSQQEVYNTSVEKIKEHIAEGRTYQVNYTMRLKSDFSTDPWNFFLHLAGDQNKYAAFINMNRYAICSVSPELFFQLEGETVTSSPMKGTVKRGRTTIEDKQQAEWLKNSPKNRAENVMIVDMVRNDLGRIAETGSVHVPDLFTIEKYPTLFQMTSTVQANTTASITDMFGALFPCASITGAPKIRSMKIISELETTPRKIYTGSIGYLSPRRKAQFNVAIRTVLIDKGSQSAEYGVGGGIVWDSDRADEYGEAILKSRVLVEPPQEFCLLETIAWTPEDGYFLLDKHIARMADSAEYFGFVFSEERLKEFLDHLAKNFKSPQRARITLDRFGRLKGESKDFHTPQKALKVKLTVSPIDSNNLFFFHKTTYRDIYPIPSSIEAKGFDDLLLYNERDELTEFTIGNLVVEINGQLWTPPTSCGLLAGTFRAHLLETGKIREKIIYKNTLTQCDKIYLINSVRKWVDVASSPI